MNTAEGLDKIFRPKSIALVGATVRPGTIGREIVHNLINFGFTGKVFPVNPKADVIHSIKCYPSILDIPDPVDLAMIVVRKDLVLPMVEECGQKGVGGLVVITSGFKEIGEEGAEREAQLLARVRHYNMRMIGPNCFGVINTHPDFSMNATFSRTAPLPGKVGFMSQSGALGEAILNHARKLGIGFSMFASVGNKADISGNALLNYWKDDPATQIILLYLESFGDPETFTRIARSITRTKPIIAVKSGKTSAGARATASHTGALAGYDVGVDALFEQCGVLRVNTIQELFDVAKGFDLQPAPKGKRVAILTNAGGPGILATDAAAGSGLDVVQLDPTTEAALREFLPPEAATGNPVDMIASATAEHYRRALDLLFVDDNVDAVICIFVPPIMVDQMAVAEAIIAASRNREKPILSCFMGPTTEGLSGQDRLRDAGIPVYTFPEELATTYALMIKSAAWRNRPPIRITEPSAQVERTRGALRTIAESGESMVLGDRALEIISETGIPVAPLVQTIDADSAAEIARRIGYPVVLKLDARGLVHKTDIGGVVTDIRSEDELRRHYQVLERRSRDKGLTDPRLVLQAMVKGGVEMALGMVRDPKFGPLVMCGLGGVFVEVVNDVAFKLPPLSEEDAHEMIRQLRGRKLLDGYRGAPPMDKGPIVRALVTLSKLVEGFPLIHELDINPFLVCANGELSRAIDARIILTPNAL